MRSETRKLTQKWLFCSCAFSSEVDSEAPGVRLRVLERVRVEEGQIRYFEAHENATAQGQEDPSPGPRCVQVLAFENKRVCVRKHAQTAAADPEERADGPVRREVNRGAAAVQDL